MPIDVTAGLTVQFPYLASNVAALEDALNDALAGATADTDFVDVFVEFQSDAVLVQGTFVTEPLSLDLPGLAGYAVSVGKADELELEASIVFDASGATLSLFDAPIYVEIPGSELLTPVVKNGDAWEPDRDQDGSLKKVSLVFNGVSLAIDSHGHVDATADLTVDLTPVQIGRSGVVVELKGMRLCLSDGAQLPAGIPAGSRGFAADSVEVYLPESMQGSFVPGEISAQDVFVGSGGFTGKLSASWPAGKPFRMASIECTLHSLVLEFKQNSLVDSRLECELVLPFFDRPVNLDVSVSGDGSLLASLSAVQPAGVDYDGGLVSFEKQGVFRATLDGISFGLEDGVATLSVSGSIQPLFPLQGTSGDWPVFRLQGLSVDSKGHVKLDGGWVDLPEHFGLDFHGFTLSITKIGFGKTGDGGKWVGFSGGLSLVANFTAGASVEGLRVTWYDDGRDTRITLDGVGVEFTVPGVLHFKGAISYRELTVGTETVHRFDGDITLELESLKLEVDAKLVVGRASGPAGDYGFFAIYLGVELPTGIPLGSLPLSLYGMAGLFALQMEPNKLDAEEWYEGWYKRTPMGVVELAGKWGNRRGSLALGGGVTLGTTDNGFTFACKALLVIVFPGPIVLLEGRANLLKEREKLSGEPMFRSLSVLDMRRGEALFGLDARYRQDEASGRVIDIRAGTEAYFHTPDDWHLYVGRRTPQEKRIRAQVLGLFEADSYFMLDPHKLATGAWMGIDRSWQFGPVGLALQAWIDGNAVVSWSPVHLHGDLWLHGSVDVHAFGFGMGLSVDALFAADMFDPYHLVADFEVTVKL